MAAARSAGRLLLATLALLGSMYWVLPTTRSGAATGDPGVGPAPSATINPSAGRTGTPIAVTGQGFPARIAIEIRWTGSDGPLVVTAATSADGDFEVAAEVPLVSPGPHPVVVLARDPDGVVTQAVTLEFTVEAPIPGQEEAGDLAGPSSTVMVAGRPPVVATPAWLWVAIGVSMAGGALVLARTRPRRHRPEP